MADISIKRAHHTTMADAKKMADKIAAKLENQYELKSSWAGDVLNFARSGVNGTLAVTAQEFKVEIKLGFFMSAFKGPIHGAIESNIDGLVKPPSAKKTAVKQPTPTATKAKK